MPRGWTAEQAPRPDEEPRRERQQDGTLSTEKKAERALLAALLPRKDHRNLLDDPLAELAALAKTAGVKVVGPHILQRRDRPDPATCLGKGTVERLVDEMAQHEGEVVIFDNDLAPRQRRNLEKLLGKKVIDRTELILDIFAAHARTPQARLQVEVAQLEYALPRLRKMWTHLDPGVGLRGPGEKQLEIDKRLIRIRIQELKRDLAKARARKEREVERRSEAYTVALVGYTNAGKSTLMNRLTEADVFVADQLFATLDTRTRSWTVGPNRNVLLSDTVGFIRHLPHRLVESFHATLEEVITADVLLHVVDASDPAPLEQVRAVREVLKSLGLQNPAEVLVLNKIDQAEPELIPWLERRLTNTLRVSAKTGEGVAGLRAHVNELAAAEEREYRIGLDVREGKAIAFLEGTAEVKRKELEGETLLFEVRCQPKVAGGIRARARKPDEVQLERIERDIPDDEPAEGEAEPDAPPADDSAASC